MSQKLSNVKSLSPCWKENFAHVLPSSRRLLKTRHSAVIFDLFGPRGEQQQLSSNGINSILRFDLEVSFEMKYLVVASILFLSLQAETLRRVVAAFL